MKFLRNFWGLLLLILLPLSVLHPGVLGNQTIGPWDETAAYGALGGGPKEIAELDAKRPYDVLQMDAVLQFYGWRELVFESWGRREEPVWNPYQFGGSPLMGNSQSAAYYPLHVVAGVMKVPTSKAISLLAWFHISWALIGVYLLVRRRTDELTGFMAGLLLFAAPFLTAWVGLASVVTTVAWIPWLWLSLDRLGEHKRFAMFGLAVSTGMILLAGHLQFAFLGLLSAAIYAIATAFAVRCPRTVYFGALAVLLGVAVASPQLSVVLRESKESHRRGAATAEGYAAYAASAVQWWELPAVLDPSALGSMRELSRSQELQPLSTYWPALVKVGANPAESAISLGPLLLFGLFLSRARSKEWVPALSVFALGLLLMLPTPLSQALYFGLPGFSSTGSPGRAAILFVMGGVMLAALGWHRLRNEPALESARPWGTLAIGVFAVLFSLVPLSRGLSSWSPELNPVLASLQNEVSSNVMVRVLAVLAMLGVLAFGTVWRKGAPRFAYLAVFALGLAPLLLTKASVLHGDVPARPAALSEEGIYIGMINPSWEILVRTEVFCPPNLCTIWKVAEVAGYDSMIRQSTVDRLESLNEGPPTPPTNGNMMMVRASATPLTIARHGATRMWGPGMAKPERIRGDNGRALPTEEDDFSTRQPLLMAALGALFVAGLVEASFRKLDKPNKEEVNSDEAVEPGTDHL